MFFVREYSFFIFNYMYILLIYFYNVGFYEKKNIFIYINKFEVMRMIFFMSSLCGFMVD